MKLQTSLKTELHFLAGALCSLATIIFVATAHPEIGSIMGCVAFANLALGLKVQDQPKVVRIRT